jgi:hypothetical protein
MRYRFEVTKGKEYRVYNKIFPSDVVGKGKTEDAAFSHFLTLLFDYFKSCLKTDIPIPESNIKGKSVKSFGLPLNMSLKIRLHNVRIGKNIGRTELARLLALKPEEVPNDDWRLQTLRTIIPSSAPKYKNVQRLFDLSHDSTVREIEQAFRVLGFTVDPLPMKK